MSRVVQVATLAGALDAVEPRAGGQRITACGLLAIALRLG